MMSAREHIVAGFTLIEILLASAAAALVLVAVYGVFTNAMKLRDVATERVRESRERMRATKVIRDDLRNALISGGLLASVVEGDATQSGAGNSGFPGYLKIMTTNGKDTDDDLWGDVQQVEYYIVKDPTNTTGVTNAGELVRAVTRDLLDTTTPPPKEEPILERVESLKVAFYDGTNWQTSWDYDASASGSNSGTGGSSSTSGSSGGTNSGQAETLPVAIRVDIQQAPATLQQPTPPPIEVLMPWTTQPFTSPTPTPSASPA
jgi:prepilin-type N-terminal cleavage/methylation domain-containing protein